MTFTINQANDYSEEGLEGFKDMKRYRDGKNSKKMKTKQPTNTNLSATAKVHRNQGTMQRNSTIQAQSSASHLGLSHQLRKSQGNFQGSLIGAQKASKANVFDQLVMDSLRHQQVATNLNSSVQGMQPDLADVKPQNIVVQTSLDMNASQRQQLVQHGSASNPDIVLQGVNKPMFPNVQT